MENNTDIFVLTSVVIVLFLVFIIATVREFNAMSSEKFVEEKEGGPRAEMLRMIAKLFTDDRLGELTKQNLTIAVKNALEDLNPKDAATHETDKRDT
jgi:hypothetical protein